MSVYEDTSQHASNHAASNAGWQPERMSLMVQPSTIALQGTAAIDQMEMILESIRNRHRDQSGPGYIENLVVTDLASVKDGKLLTEVLDRLIPYLPGGEKATFTKAFIGTIGQPDIHALISAGMRSARRNENSWDVNVEGIRDGELIDWHVETSIRLGTEFAVRYPGISHDWYLSWEGYFPAIMYSDTKHVQLGMRVKPSLVRAAYLEHQQRLIRALSAIRPNQSYLWSPALDRPWAQVTVDNSEAEVCGNIVEHFDALSQVVQGAVVGLVPGRLWFVPQDALSRPHDLVGGAFNNTIETRLEWFAQLSGLDLKIERLEINAELFRTEPCPQYGSPAAVLGRLHAYEQAGVPIGPSFDLNWWYIAVILKR